MLETHEPNERLSAAYRQAGERMQVAREGAVRRTEAAMKATAGWLAAAKAAAAQSVLEATRSECDVQITRLIEAHADAGDQDATKVGELVRTRFLSGLTAPGLHFIPNSGPEAAALAVVAVRHAAEFESTRDGLATEVAARFRAVVDDRRSRVPSVIETTVKASRRRLGDSRALFAVLVMTLLLSLAGVSWLDVLRQVGALL